MLRTTCRSFNTCGLIEGEAHKRCQEITRAQGLQPLEWCACNPLPLPYHCCTPRALQKADSLPLRPRRKKETWMDLLRCLSSQPQAAAQATALSLGAYHTVALMAQNPADPADLQLYAFGRGEPRINKRYNSRNVLQIPSEERATPRLLLHRSAAPLQCSCVDI